MGLYPAYRLIDGQVMCQEKPGARWTPVDHHIVEEMLSAYNGIPMDARARHVAASANETVNAGQGSRVGQG
jgi:hypothetical protein